MKPKRIKTNFKKVIKEQSDLAGEWSDHFEKSIKSETTRAKVILSACYLEELLTQLLKILLNPSEGKNDPLFNGPQAPLSTFSAKIELTNRIGIISKETKNGLHLIRKIRNKFAHSLTNCDFNDNQIKKWNAELNRLTDYATPKRRLTFSKGDVGDFEKSTSWLVYWIRHITQQIPTECPKGCPTECPIYRSEIERRSRIKKAKPGDRI